MKTIKILKKNKKGIELTFQTIVILIILIITMIVIIFFFANHYTGNENTLQNISGNAISQVMQ